MGKWPDTSIWRLASSGLGIALKLPSYNCDCLTAVKTVLTNIPRVKTVKTILTVY